MRLRYMAISGAMVTVEKSILPQFAAKISAFNENTKILESAMIKAKMFGTKIATLLGSLLFGLLLFVSVRMEIYISHYAIFIVIFIVMLLPVLPIFATRSNYRLDHWLNFAFGAILTSLPTLVVYNIENELLFELYILGLLISAAWVFYVDKLRKKLSTRKGDSLFKFPLIKLSHLIIFFLTVFVLRAVLSWAHAANIPNPERSIFLFGYEIHHYVFGLMGVAFTWPLIGQVRYCSRGGRMLYICFFIALAAVWDQIAFLWVPYHADAGYFSILSWCGAIMGVSLVVWAYARGAVNGQQV